MSKFRSPDIFRFCQNQHIGSIVGFPKGFPYIGIPIGISLYGRLASDIDYRQMSNVRCEIVSPRLAIYLCLSCLNMCSHCPNMCLHYTQGVWGRHGPSPRSEQKPICFTSIRPKHVRAGSAFPHAVAFLVYLRQSDAHDSRIS